MLHDRKVWLDGKTTLIAASGYATNTLGTVMGANSAELRFVSVTNTGGGSNPYAIAIYNDSVNASAKFTHVTAVTQSHVGLGLTSFNSFYHICE